MNKQEAIEKLKALSRMFEEVLTGAIAEAISALETQIPNKPKEGSRAVIVGIDGANCSVCGGLIFMPSEFCGHCGQAIDWRNEDE